MRLHTALAAALVLTGSAASAATPALALAPGPVQAVRFTYEVHAIGLTVAQIEATMVFDQSGYRATMAYHTVGLYGALKPARSATQSQGKWTADGVAPVRYASTARLRGEDRRVLINYRDGNPDVQTLVPPNAGRWEPVAPAMQAHTIDDLSAIVLLIHHVVTTGACNAATRTFDGRRLTAIEATTVGDQQLPRGADSPYVGTALRCSFQGQQLAGFENNDSPFARKPHDGAAWFAQVLPGGPSLPVRISFATRWFGAAVAVMTHAELIAPGAAAAPGAAVTP